jgi:hypothetical protein
MPQLHRYDLGRDIAVLQCQYITLGLGIVSGERSKTLKAVECSFLLVPNVLISVDFVKCLPFVTPRLHVTTSGTLWDWATPTPPFHETGPNGRQIVHPGPTIREERTTGQQAWEVSITITFTMIISE